MRTMNRRRLRILTVAALLVVTASGCLLQLPAPEINLHTEPAYNDQEILIPYELYGEGRYARARWTLAVFTGVEFEEIESREIRIPSGSSGVLQLGELPEARFRLDFDLLTTRDGSYETVPYITKWAEFVVDRTPPPTPVDGAELTVTPNAAVAALDGSNRGFVTLTYNHIPGPQESTVRLLVVVNEARPPVSDRDEYPGERFPGDEVEVWEAGVGGGFTAEVIVVAVDEAGNRSSPEIIIYTTI